MDLNQHLAFGTTSVDADHHRRILLAEADHHRLVRVARKARTALRRAVTPPPESPPLADAETSGTRVTQHEEETAGDRRYAVSR
jgi:hypothetical protein